MTAPLPAFYGGLVRKKNVLSVMMQCIFLRDRRPFCGESTDIRCRLAATTRTSATANT
ncbi:MAG: hypothetical protein R3C99_09295 [Pirellulaceae bacterium]